MNSSFRSRFTAAFIVVVVAVWNHIPANAADAQPGDFIPAPAGTNLALMYYSYSDLSSYIDKNGNAIPNSELVTSVAIARYVRYFDLGGMIADINILQPFGGFPQAKLGGAELNAQAFGLGDTILVFTIWPVNDPKNNVYFGIATYLTLPTGNYDRDFAVNLSSNRWSVAIQPGLVVPLWDKWSMDLVGDITFYGDNSDGAGGALIEQQPSMTALAWLKYSFSQSTVGSVGITHTYLGEQKFNYVSQGDSSTTAIRGAISQMLTPSSQVLLELSHDIDANNSFKKEIGALFRFTAIF